MEKWKSRMPGRNGNARLAALIVRAQRGASHVEYLCPSVFIGGFESDLFS
jgi:hypothetical protein